MASETGDLDERREDLLQSIEQDEEQLLEAVHELAEVTEKNLDLARHIRASPVAWVVGAFCVGLWMGMGSGRISEHSRLGNSEHPRLANGDYYRRIR